jgi:hypothetical protein
MSFAGGLLYNQCRFLKQKIPLPGGRGQGRGEITDVYTLPLPLPEGGES